MTDNHLTGDGEPVITLQQLIRARMDERGWSYGDLETRSDGRLTKGRWQQLGSGTRLRSFPEPHSMQVMADVLEVDITSILLAAAQSLGLDARRRGSELAQLLPAGTDLLSPQMRDIVLSLIRALVAERLANSDDSEGFDHAGQGAYEWPKSQSVKGRNAPGRTNETRS